MHQPETPTWRDWLIAIVRLRVLWPLPALLFLACVLPFSPQLWVAPQIGRKVWSQAELSLVCSALGTLLYWLVLLLSQLGYLYAPRANLAQTPSDAEQQLAAIAMRGVCLLMAYGGPLLALLGP